MDLEEDIEDQINNYRYWVLDTRGHMPYEGEPPGAIKRNEKWRYLF